MWHGWTYSTLLPAAVCLLATFVVGRVLAHHWNRLRLRLREIEPKCAKCKYVVHAGSGRICPECGHDLCQTGVLTPSTWLPAYPLGRQLLLGAALLAPALAVGCGITCLLPIGWKVLGVDGRARAEPTVIARFPDPRGWHWPLVACPRRFNSCVPRGLAREQVSARRSF